ncbi:hypothetical protein BKA81DRAFT_413449 [Phyllosticta paracitricarpa]
MCAFIVYYIVVDRKRVGDVRLFVQLLMSFVSRPFLTRRRRLPASGRAGSSRTELMTGKWNGLLLSASDKRWKNQCKVLKTTLTGVSRADAGVPFLERESLAFLHKVAHDPGVARNSKRIMETSARYTYSAFAQQTFGLEVTQHAERDVLCHIHGKSKQISTDRFEGDNTTVSREEETLGGSQTDGEKPQQSANLVDPAQRDHFAFGAGRRICPGTNVAERSLAIAMMRILWAFNVRPSTTASHPLDPRDLPGDPPGNLSDEMSVVLEPKSVKMARAIDEAWSREKTEFPRQARRCL